MHAACTCTTAFFVSASASLTSCVYLVASSSCAFTALSSCFSSTSALTAASTAATTSSVASSAAVTGTKLCGASVTLSTSALQTIHLCDCCSHLLQHDSQAECPHLDEEMRR